MKALHLFCFLLWLPFMAACNHTPTAPSTSSGTDPSPTPSANSSASATPTQAPTTKPTIMPTQTASATPTQAPTTKPTIMPTQTASAPSTSSGTATPTQAPTTKSTPTQGGTTMPTTTPIANTQPASQLIYIYQREGGFAGFCDTLTVRPQEAYWKSCKGQSATVPLNPETTQQLQQLLTQYAPYQNSSEDNPGGSDSMTESIQFQGNGNEEMTSEVEKMLRIIGSELLGEAYQRQ
ncbi:MAG: hypothetical protein ACPGWR_12170 [Ardenticatenaceae bacterium]